ncbi:hypothetical protein B0A48_16222 [Cryoendolithus antarcticus]|uniref:Carbohydrate kinase PfkB domain-containing protein n=1 Tax=Cryoendolithus antarcticus TaxID=1507870 RepID=A0A1V8SGD6_9PEZI|nr:hypothetical protein B0A48_16222 [Cryoendolithus antarcticus]
MDFCTLGMFIIDDIYPPPSHPDQIPQKDIIGGAGTYSAIGARLLYAKFIASWQTGVLLRPRDALTTRGWNGYGENDHRAFKYLTEKKRLTADDLTDELLGAKSFHLICSPTRCIELVQRIGQRRREVLGSFASREIIIWEPVPDMCTPAELHNTLEALKWVDVISPNHEELAALFGFRHGDTFDAEAVISQASRLLQHGVGILRNDAVVVRCGKEGCYVAQRGPSVDHDSACFLPPYLSDSSRVVDPTGGGNGFLGGFAVGLVRYDVAEGLPRHQEAALWGTVAAGFCIEQVGMPVLSKDDEGEETWNGERVEDRMRDYRLRVTGRSTR